MFQYKYLNKENLRVKKNEIGTRDRSILKITVVPSTLENLKRIAEYGKGKYGSSVIELALNLFYEIVTEGENLDEVAIRFRNAVNPAFAIRNIERLLRILRS